MFQPMVALSLQQQLEIATQIAIEAAALVRTYDGSNVNVQTKDGSEPVTEADRKASELIVAALNNEFPKDAVLSEEAPDDGSRLENDRVWMVDPIDGTRDFIRGDEGYAVMIGLCIEGRPRIGVVSQPPTNKTYGALIAEEPAGNQAWVQIGDSTRTKLSVSRRTQSEGIRLVASKSHRGPEIDAVRQALGVSDEINIGGVGLKMGLVAEGLRDLYVYPGDKTKLWDACAPEAILTAAGGQVTDMSGAPLVYTDKELHNLNGIIASNRLLHADVVTTLSKASLPNA